MSSFLWFFFATFSLAQRRSTSLDFREVSCQTSILNTEHDRQQKPATNTLRTCQHQLQTPALSTFSFLLSHCIAQTPDWTKSKLFDSTNTPCTKNQPNKTQNKIKSNEPTTIAHSNILSHAYTTIAVWITQRKPSPSAAFGARQAQGYRTYYRKQRSGWSYY